MSNRLHETLTDEQISELREFVISIFPKAHREWIPKSSDPREIFEAITHNQLWDCCNYQPLEQIIKKFGNSDPEMASIVALYKDDLLQFQQSNTVTVTVSQMFEP